jgi:hypothetical protein
MTPAQRKLRAQIAANSRWSKENSAANAARGQAGLVARFEREVDPECALPLPERARRADAAYRAHFQRLALRSAKSRAVRKSAPVK